MKQYLNHLCAAFVAALCLSGCGGGGGGIAGTGAPQVLPNDDASAQAYTLGWLQAHPDSVVQPEHTLIVPVDPAGPAQKVSIYFGQSMTLSLMLPPSGSVLSSVSIVDDSGSELLRHDGNGNAASAAVPAGYATVVFTPNPAAADGKIHTVFLKLADTPGQAQQRQLQATQGLGLGEVATDSCITCSFNNADLSFQNLSHAVLAGSSFDGANINGTNFTGVACSACRFTNMRVANSGTKVTTFQDAQMQGSTFSTASGARILNVLFNGTNFDLATLSGQFVACDFSPSPATQASTSFRGGDLTAAILQIWANNGMLHGVDFSNAKVAATTFIMAMPPTSGLNTVFAGARFDGMTPNNLFTGDYFKNYDLSGTSFGGIDLSGMDLSSANVKMSSTTDLSKAILSNGTTGANLTGQGAAFPSPYTGWAGTVADENSGKDLRYVNLAGIDLSKADLTRARFDGANLVGADLNYTNLYGASFRGALLGVTPGGGAQAASLIDAYMPYSDFSDADLRSVSLDGAHIYTADGDGVSFNRARLDSASFVGADLMGAKFNQASMNDTDLGAAALINANFDGAALVNAKMQSAYLQGADFSSAGAITGLNLNNAAVATTKGNWDFPEYDGSVHPYSYNPTALGAIAQSSSVTCPSGSRGPCSGPSLVPTTTPPYPPVPKCVPLFKYHYENCDPGWKPPSD